MLRSAVASAAGQDSYNVATEAAHAVNEELASATPVAVFVYAAIKFDQDQVLAGVASVFPDIPIVGASTAGEITTEGPLTQQSVAVMALASDSMVAKVVSVADIADTTHKKGEDLAQALLTNETTSPSLCILHTDTLTANISGLLRGIEQKFNHETPLVGGSSGDGGKFKTTYQYANQKALTGAAVGLGLWGHFSHAIGVKHGWNPFGLPKKITKSEGSIVYEIDNKPAIDLYKDYLGDDIEDRLKDHSFIEMTRNYPLGITITDSEELALRAPLSVDEKGAITCGGEVPEGSEVRLMIGSREEAIEAAKQAARAAVLELEVTPKAALIFDSYVREKLLANQENARREINAIREIIGESTPLIGFYTYAEQAPQVGQTKHHTSGSSVFLNETVVVVLLGDPKE